MAQHVIDKRLIDKRTIEQLTDLQIDIVPQLLRNFGAVPNFSLVKTGDLILSSGFEPNLVERSISLAQSSAGFSDNHSCWTHAAVFLYGTLVAEAVPEHGVRVHSLYEDMLRYVLRVRRPRVTDEQGARIALRALADGRLGAHRSSGGGAATDATASNGHRSACAPNAPR
jgi:hypothetical protein